LRRRVLPAVHHYNGEKGAFWQTQRKFFYFPCLLPTTIWRYGLPKIFENGRKKSSKPFSRFTAYMPL